MRADTTKSVTRPMRHRHRPSFPYELRAREAREAHRAVHTTFAQLRRREDRNDPATVAWLTAIARFREAAEAAYPPGFWDDVARLEKGDVEALEMAIRFLEADPYFDRSGYVKADLLRIMNGLPLDPEQTVRLRASSCPQCLHHSPTMTRSTMSSACIISAAVTTSGGVNVSTLPIVVLNESP